MYIEATFGTKKKTGLLRQVTSYYWIFLLFFFFYLNDFHVSSVLTTDLDAQNNGMDMESVRVDSSFPSIPYDCVEPMQRVYPAIMY